MAIALGSARRASTYSSRGDFHGQGRLSPVARAVERNHGLAPGCWSLTTASDFYSLESVWRELAADTPWPSPFHSWEFAVEWFDRFVVGRAGGATGRFMVGVAVDDARQVIGLAPMFEEYARGQRGLGLVLQPFGRSHSMETMTDEPVIVLRRHAEHRALAMLIANIAAQVRVARWDVAVLPQYAATGPSRALVSISPRLDHVQVTRQSSAPLVLDLPDSFDALRARLSKSMRDNIAYYPRRLQREQGDWHVGFATSPADVSATTRELVDLHRARARWSEGVRHRNHIETQRESAFLHRWFHRLALRGEVKIARLTVRGEVIAAQAFVERAGCIAVYYSGQAERWRRYSPLTVIMAETVRDAIARRVQRLVFPPGDEPWKTRWGAISAEPVQETSIYSTELAAVLRGLFRRLHAKTDAPEAQRGGPLRPGRRPRAAGRGARTISLVRSRPRDRAAGVARVRFG
jgi:CelD/BcsL family acetyltransferase involved in cellulose biosynthesis